MSRDILDTIDGAVRDWTTSGDAMRWSTEPAPSVDPVSLAIHSRVARVTGIPPDLVVAITVDVTAFEAAMRQFVGFVNQSSDGIARFSALLSARPDRRRAQVRAQRIRRELAHRDRRRARRARRSP